MNQKMTQEQYNIFGFVAFVIVITFLVLWLIEFLFRIIVHKLNKMCIKNIISAYSSADPEQKVMLQMILSQKDDLYKSETYKRKKTEKYLGVINPKQQYADMMFLIANSQNQDSKLLFEQLKANRKYIQQQLSQTKDFDPQISKPTLTNTEGIQQAMIQNQGRPDDQKFLSTQIQQYENENVDQKVYQQTPEQITSNAIQSLKNDIPTKGQTTSEEFNRDMMNSLMM